ncbi:MAG: hypothetical protein NC321_11915 [Clostridium sp.]|nr:hypothetical protein [Clostridium sp.]
MNKLQKILLIVFCLGVLLCGIGSGVAFTEFGALSYGGRQILGEPDMRTESFDVEFKEGKKLQGISGMRGRQTGFQTDDSVPENTVRFSVTYNAENVTMPYAYWDEETDRIFLSCEWSGTHDDLEYMMEAKDVLLQNLKEGKLVSFDVAGIEEVTISVNPETLENIWMPGVL